MNKKRGYSSIFLYILLIFLVFLCITPLYITLINSTHTNISITKNLNILPGSNLINNYKEVSSKMNILRGFTNSLQVSIPSVILSLYFGALTAFGFSKYRFKEQKVLFGFLLITMMVPAQLGLIGYYYLHNSLGLLDTYWPIIIPWISNPATVFFMKMYIDSAIHDALLESARIDGAKEFFIFNKIILPLVSPALATLAIFNFVGSWNSYIMPLTILFSKDKYTLPLLVSLLKGVYMNNYGAIYFGISISIIPIIITYACFSRKIIGGVSMGAVKE